jgi:hypothetical protein
MKKFEFRLRVHKYGHGDLLTKATPLTTNALADHGTAISGGGRGEGEIGQKKL